MSDSRLFFCSAAIALTTLVGCETAPVADACAGPLHHDFQNAVADASSRLESGCATHFDRYFESLLARAEDRPEAGNKRMFSTFLVDASDAGVISRRQAADLYNRYFNVRFVSLQGDFNTCSQVCPEPDATFRAMTRELADKERGLMRISNDAAAYYRADELLAQSRLVITATCDACGAVE